MDSLKSVAAKVKHSPQIIRKTFSGSPRPYAKVLEGEKSKGEIISINSSEESVVWSKMRLNYNDVRFICE